MGRRTQENAILLVVQKLDEIRGHEHSHFLESGLSWENVCREDTNFEPVQALPLYMTRSNDVIAEDQLMDK